MYRAEHFFGNQILIRLETIQTYFTPYNLLITLLTTSIFNSVESTLPNSNSVHLGQGVGKVKVYLETEQHKPATDQNDINNADNKNRKYFQNT
jgi:hypothetical protein